MLSGLVCGRAAWIGTAAGLYGRATVDALGSPYPTLAGNLVSIARGTIVTVVWSVISPQNYDFSGTRAHGAPADWMSRIRAEAGTDDAFDKEKASIEVHGADGGECNISYVRAAGLDPAQIGAMPRRVQLVAVGASAVLVVVVPAVSAAAGVWTPSGLGAWVWLGFVWLCMSIYTVSIHPLIEARSGLCEIYRNMCRRQRRTESAM